ncbi:hypothetical protein ACJIZ3_013280 [Penstemon smallii]|uniref:DOG1 domain-containing protein n=1 Tax=Penstemon smallii TaxID=265156 RepID=A0ABD3USP6_9LAMI
MASSSDQVREHSCFQEWIAQQECDLSELLHYMEAPANSDETSAAREVCLRQLVDKNIRHFQAYSEKRIRLARDDVSPFFSPTWCSIFENSLLWLGGCRPTLLIRLVYALCGLQIESQLDKFLEGIRTGNLGELSARQLSLINDLQGRTIKEEGRLSSCVASLQEKIGDQPIATIVNESSSEFLEPNAKVDEALDEHEQSMVSMLEEADRLRMKTLKELMNILTPLQAVNFLAASKKLHLCVHACGKRRDRFHGRRGK